MISKRIQDTRKYTEVNIKIAVEMIRNLKLFKDYGEKQVKGIKYEVEIKR